MYSCFLPCLLLFCFETQPQNAFQSLASEIQRLVVSDKSAAPGTPSQHNTAIPNTNGSSSDTRADKGSRLIEGSTISELIHATVSAAVENAKRQWERSFLAEQADQTNKNAVLQATISVLQDRLHALEAASFLSGDVHTKFAHLEQRVVKLEAAVLAASFRDHEVQQQAAASAPSVSAEMVKPPSDIEAALNDRLFKLELAVEKEHESSLQVLDALLLHQRQLKQMQSITAGQSLINSIQYQQKQDMFCDPTESPAPWPSNRSAANGDAARSTGRQHISSRNDRSATPSRTPVSSRNMDNSNKSQHLLRRSDSPGINKRVTK